MSKFWQDFKDRILEYPILGIILIGGPISIGIHAIWVSSTLKQLKDGETWFYPYHDLWVEAHGFIFDLILFSVLIKLYENFTDKRERIKGYINTVNDFRHWQEKEGMFRIVGAVKRLCEEGISIMNLQACYLEESKLYDLDLSGSKFGKANLKKARLANTILKNTNFKGANLEEAILVDSDLESAIFFKAVLFRTLFNGANLKDVDFQYADLRYAKFGAANMTDVQLLGARVHHIGWIDDLDKNLSPGSKIKGVNLIKSKYKVIPEPYDEPQFHSKGEYEQSFHDEEFDIFEKDGKYFSFYKVMGFTIVHKT